MIKGMAELEKAFDRLDISDVEEGEITFEMAEIIAERARDLVPVDTGELQDTIQAVQDGRSSQVQAGTSHALPIEFGTSKMAAQPYMRPAYEETKQEVVKSLKDRMMDKIHEH